VRKSAVTGRAVAQTAGTVYTTAQFRAGRIFDCFVVNTGSGTVKITTQIVDSAGHVDGENANHVIVPGGLGGTSMRRPR
jgi:hypothetical protein